MLLKALSSLTSPLNNQQIEKIQDVVAQLSSEQLAWVSGYFWGLNQLSAEEPDNLQSQPLPVSSQSDPHLTIIYASQTGNAKGLATQLEAKAKDDGLAVSLLCCDDYKPRDLAKETHLIIIISTHGEGDPPDDALLLHEFLHSKKAAKLDKLHYAVLGLGDSSYEFFCQAAKDLDALFSKLGAKAMFPRLDCDLDYAPQAKSWSEDVLGKVKEHFISNANKGVCLKEGSQDDLDHVVVPLHLASAASLPAHNKQNPFLATLLTNQKITGNESGKDVRHIEICLDNSGLTYQPGDSLGVYYLNCPQLVDEILGNVSLTGDETVSLDGLSLPLRQALIEKYEVTGSHPKQVADYARLSDCKTLLTLTQNKEKLRKYANKVQLVDVLGMKKTALCADQLLSLLRRLTPRLYSIASSSLDVGDEVHLSVGLVAFERNNKTRLGGASGFLAQRAEKQGSVNVFIEHNAHFKLPADDNAPLIMIGPGTGIAPFRAFMQERNARGAAGKNWLFFGDRTFTDDFLYQIEWQRYLKDSLLTRLDLAFSRDQKEKVYVQHKMREQAKELWQWLENGAYVYVCGDAGEMAKEVHDALICIIEEQSGSSRKEAESYLNDLRKTKRYQKDVY